MPFIKGHSGNPAGKPKGALAHKTKEHLSRARRLVDAIEAHPSFKTMLDGLSERELASLYKDLLEYLEPKLNRMEFADAEGGKVVIKVQHSLAPPQACPVQPIEIAEPEYKILPNERASD